MEEYSFDDLKYLQIPLPEELLKLKWLGDFERMNKIIEMKLSKDISIGLKKRLIHEQEIIKRMPKEYPLSYQEALDICCSKFIDFKEEELIQLQDENAVEWIFINGKPKFRNDFFDNILKTRNDYVKRLKNKNEIESRENNFKLLNDTMHEIKEKGKLTYHFHLKTGICLLYTSRCV